MEAILKETVVRIEQAKPTFFFYLVQELTDTPHML
jgi:hypothetical protein